MSISIPLLPPGWIAVKVAPDDAMQMAGAIAIRFDTTTLNKLFTANKVFEAMCKASPSLEKAFAEQAHQGAEPFMPAPNQYGFEIKSKCGRTWFMPLEVVKADFVKFQVENENRPEQEVLKEIEDDPNCLRIWFVEQFTWPEVIEHGKQVVDASPEQILRALDAVRTSNFAEPWQDYVAHLPAPPLPPEQVVAKLLEALRAKPTDDVLMAACNKANALDAERFTNLRDNADGRGSLIKGLITILESNGQPLDANPKRKKKKP